MLRSGLYCSDCVVTLVTLCLPAGCTQGLWAPGARKVGALAGAGLLYVFLSMRIICLYLPCALSYISALLYHYSHKQ